MNVYGSSDTSHAKPFLNSQLRRSDGYPFSVELRRDYPYPRPLMAETVIGHKAIAWWKEVTPQADVIEFLANPHELGGPCSWKDEDLSCGRGEKRDLIFHRRSSLDRIPIIGSLFQCWIFGSVFQSNWVPCDQLCSYEKHH
ncbi:hypothetical protein AVEN_102287-1 [Araneus ventricosus]|uniref:Uncharacterized protein n=1 Tax=Araneus ventricosus TaxID=182803 RepID=A0A4Y2IHP8_ARAVE|nr:hypothetical protein AVEN_102287-1 [Araneus ventricosus]